MKTNLGATSSILLHAIVEVSAAFQTLVLSRQQKKKKRKPVDTLWPKMLREAL